MTDDPLHPVTYKAAGKRPDKSALTLASDASNAAVPAPSPRADEGHGRACTHTGVAAKRAAHEICAI